MFKKTVLRLLRMSGIVASLLVTTLCVAGYLAFQEPDYYTQLRTEQPSAADVAMATGHLEHERAAYLRWRRRLVDNQREQPNQELPSARDGVHREDPAGGTHELRYSSADLNALLASETRRVGGGEVEDPRVRITSGRLDFACGLQTKAACFVLSVELTPSLRPDGVLALDLESARVGHLPIPAETIAGFLPRKTSCLSGNLYLDLTATKPRLTLDLSDRANNLLADSLECGDGEVTVRFVAQQRVN